MISPKIEKLQVKHNRLSEVSTRADAPYVGSTTAGIAASIAIYRLKELALFELIEQQEMLADTVFGKTFYDELPQAEAQAGGAKRYRFPLKKRPQNLNVINSNHGEEIARINDLEHKIETASGEVNHLMFQILDMQPRLNSDAMVKLRFISSMFLDGADIAANRMSQLMDECIEVMDKKPELVAAD